MSRTRGLASFHDDEARWRAVRTRDAAATDAFCYAVSTTGIYCRPGCPSRLPRREHVRFHDTARDAERAGYRACRRCQPNSASRRKQLQLAIARACRLIEQAETPPPLATLARVTGLSRFHFHRVFKSETGLTPKAYATANRRKRLVHELANRRSVTDAMYGAGFQSSGRFYGSAGELLGMLPTAFRARGSGARIRFAMGSCSLGTILVAMTERGVCAIELGADAEQLIRSFQDRFTEAELVGGDPAFEQYVARVVGWVDGVPSARGFPLDIRGTVFQQRVWQALRAIPEGGTMSYAELAQCLGVPRAVRAVARACASNPLAVAIPCHRVVRSDGSLSGYRWGIERKALLLQRERAQKPTSKLELSTSSFDAESS